MEEDFTLDSALVGFSAKNEVMDKGAEEANGLTESWPFLLEKTGLVSLVLCADSSMMVIILGLVIWLTVPKSLKVKVWSTAPPRTLLSKVMIDSFGLSAGWDIPTSQSSED